MHDLNERYLGTFGVEEFKSIREIDEYFSISNLESMFGPGEYPDADRAKAAVISEWEPKQP